MSYIKYIKTENCRQPRESMRMVNQPEIHNFILHNPGLTENQIMFKLYGYDRPNSIDSNKKYADRLRALLFKGKIGRVRALTSLGKRYIYYSLEAL